MTVLSYSQLIEKVKANREMVETSVKPELKSDIYDQAYNTLDSKLSTDLQKLADSSQIPDNCVITLHHRVRKPELANILKPSEVMQVLADVGQHLSDKYQGQLGYNFSYTLSDVDMTGHMTICAQISFENTTETEQTFPEFDTLTDEELYFLLIALKSFCL